MSGGRSTACARSSRRSRNCSSSGSDCVPMSGRPHRLPERCERAVEVHPHRRLRALQHRRDLRRRQLLLYLQDPGRRVRPPLVARDEGVNPRPVALGRAPPPPPVREPPAAIAPSPPRPPPRLIHCKGGAPGPPPASTPPALLPVRLARLVDVTPQ